MNKHLKKMLLKGEKATEAEIELFNAFYKVKRENERVKQQKHAWRNLKRYEDFQVKRCLFWMSQREVRKP